MNETGIKLRDPTAENRSVIRSRRPPIASLESRGVALLDIGKMRGDEYVDRLAELFVSHGIEVHRFRKPTNTRTAPVEMLQAIADVADAVVIALSDCGSCTSCSTHDLVDLDARGVAGVSVLTEEFRDAFGAQCQKLGFDGASLFVPHPMQNRTTEELRAFADGSFDAVVAAISEKSVGN